MIIVYLLLVLVFTMFTVIPLANAVEEFTGSYALRLLVSFLYGSSVGYIFRLLIQ